MTRSFKVPWNARLLHQVLLGTGAYSLLLLWSLMLHGKPLTLQVLLPAAGITWVLVQFFLDHHQSVLVPTSHSLAQSRRVLNVCHWGILALMVLLTYPHPRDFPLMQFFVAFLFTFSSNSVLRQWRTELEQQGPHVASRLERLQVAGGGQQFAAMLLAYGLGFLEWPIQDNFWAAFGLVLWGVSMVFCLEGIQVQAARLSHPFLLPEQDPAATHL